MKFLHFTDIHQTAPGQTISGRDPVANLERGLAHALADHADASFLAITGDLSDWGDRADYAALRARLARLPMPAHPIIGNHDDRGNFLAEFPDCADAAGFAQFRADHGGFRCLFLDTHEPGTHAGSFCAVRQGWLEAELEGHPGPFLLFLHHHPIPSMIPPMDRIGLRDDAAFRSIVARHAARIRHIFFGHCHMVMHGSCAGVPCASLRGTNHQGFPLFSEPDLLTDADLPEAYGVVFLGSDYTTCQMVEFGYEGEIRIEGTTEKSDWDRATMTR